MANCGIWNPNTRMYEAIGYDRKLETGTKEMKIRHKKIHPDKILIAELYLKIKELTEELNEFKHNLDTGDKPLILAKAKWLMGTDAEGWIIGNAVNQALKK
jgi:hypothetical protein